MKITSPDPGETATKLVADAQRLITQAGSRRPEDFLSCLAAVAGEMVLRQSRVVDLEATDMAPGQPFFSNDLNRLLSGDRSDWAQVPVNCMFGSIRSALMSLKDSWPRESFPNVGAIYELFAKARGKGAKRDEWGWAPLSIAPSHRPRIQPLRGAYNLRQSLLSEGYDSEFLTTASAISVVMALSGARNHLPPDVAIRIVLETINAMAKTMPMMWRHMVDVAKQKGLPKPAVNQWI
jgi:hypothetical protein